MTQKKFAIIDKLSKNPRLFSSIDEIVNRPNNSKPNSPIEIFEVELKSIGHYRKKQTFEKCLPDPVAAETEDKDDDDKDLDF